MASFISSWPTMAEKGKVRDMDAAEEKAPGTLAQG
jgi:hypothetical protein